jgi:CHAD domain-containing protein
VADNICVGTGFDRGFGRRECNAMNRVAHGPDALPRLRQHESIRGGLRRVLLGCLEHALCAMSGGNGTAAGRIHEARISLKRARAVLRLGDDCGLAWTSLARLRLARLAGELAAVRDAAVVAETARKLGMGVGVAEAGANPSWTAWISRLGAERRRLAHCEWPVIWRRDCIAALARSLWRLQKRERAAQRGAKTRQLHAWRKAVIVLREQLNVLRPLLTPPQQNCAGRLHRVARKLGAVQDLTLLIARERRGAPSFARELLLMRARYDRRQTVRRAYRLAKGLTKRLHREFSRQG